MIDDDVSVIIPVFNEAKFLGEAISSVLNQSFSPREIIVIDDGSTDDTKLVCQAFGDQVIYAYQENAGSSSARNYGIDLATSKLIAFLDADDIWLPDKLALQINQINANPELETVFGCMEQFDDIGVISPPQPAVMPSVCLARREVFQQIGGFNQAIHIGEFVDWYARAVDANVKSSILPQLLARRRIHEHNKGKVLRSEYRIYLQVIKQVLDRRRQNHLEV